MPERNPADDPADLGISNEEFLYMLRNDFGGVLARWMVVSGRILGTVRTFEKENEDLPPAFFIRALGYILVSYANTKFPNKSLKNTTELAVDALRHICHWTTQELEGKIPIPINASLLPQETLSKMHVHAPVVSDDDDYDPEADGRDSLDELEESEFSAQLDEPESQAISQMLEGDVFDLVMRYEYRFPHLQPAAVLSMSACRGGIQHLLTNYHEEGFELARQLLELIVNDWEAKWKRRHETYEA